MAITFDIPKSPTKQVYESDVFLGADFTSEASNIDENKSPNTVNMIRSVPGKIRKRMGYYPVVEYPYRINGIFYFSAAKTWIVHAGQFLYNLSAVLHPYWWSGLSDTASGTNVTTYHNIATGPNGTQNPYISLRHQDITGTQISGAIADHKSVAFELNQQMIVLDGTNVTRISVLSNGNVSAGDISFHAYIPTLTIDKNPEGGGQDYEPLNLIQPRFKELFYCDSDHATTKKFQLSFGHLDSTIEVTAKVLDSDGNWIEKREDRDFTVNYTTGEVTFINAPGQSPVEGESNVEIQAAGQFSANAERVYRCTIGTLYGVNGAKDRIFISGNPDSGFNDDGVAYTYRNCDWFSGQNDPTYWPDINYSKIGSDGSAIMGYSVVNNLLVTHKDENELGQSIVLRQGDIVDNEAVFKQVGSLHGIGAVSKYCFSYLGTEPVFLTPLGIYAVTSQDITGEKYSQNRSYYLDGKLLKERNLFNANGFTWKDYYIVSINEHLYVLDGLQPLSRSSSTPYSTRLYAGFYFDNIPATCFANIDNQLVFGTSSGKIFAFYSDETALASYNDDGEPISCVWETADIDKQLFYKKKTYRYIALRCMPEIQSSVRVYAQKEGQWNLLKEDNQKLKYFSYKNLQYSKMTYSTNETQKVTSAKIRLKKLDHTRFRFENDSLYEPLSINNFAVEYTQAGNVK